MARRMVFFNMFKMGPTLIERMRNKRDGSRKLAKW
jgi:hypothetical protein